MAKNKKKADPRKAAEHALYLAAIEQGYRPLRAATMPDGRKVANRRACRDRRLWD